MDLRAGEERGPSRNAAGVGHALVPALMWSRRGTSPVGAAQSQAARAVGHHVGWFPYMRTPADGGHGTTMLKGCKCFGLEGDRVAGGLGCGRDMGQRRTGRGQAGALWCMGGSTWQRREEFG